MSIPFSVLQQEALEHRNMETGFKMSDFGQAEFTHKHILNYNPTKLFSYGFINPRGSVFCKGTVLRTLAMASAGTFVALPVFECGDTKDGYTFCFPILTSSEGLIFASLVSFLLGLFISTTFSRWWAIREKLGVIMNNTAYETMLLTNFVVNEESSQNSVRTIIRWLNLAHSLVYKHANRDSDFSRLAKEKLVTPEEIEKLQSYGVPPAMVYGWCMKAVKDLINQNKINSAVVGSAINCIGASFMATQELLAFINTQMPYAYLHLLAITTKIHLAFIIFYGGGIISSGIQGDDWTRIALGYTIIITNNFIYEGLLHIHSALENPLGDDVGDFPKHNFASNTRALCHSLESI